MVECKICKNKYDSDKKLHAHLKLHKIYYGDYYLKYYPRKDMHTGQPIPFKSKEQYFSSDFTDRLNLIDWILNTDKSIVQEYARVKIKERKKEKQLKYALSHAEFKTLMIPSVGVFENEDYNEYCKSIGLICKYKYNTHIELDKLSNIDIFIDTREQLPLVFDGYEPKKIKLDYADYLLVRGEKKLFVERKSLNDFYSTLSGGYERFKREIERASKEDLFIVAVEAKINDVKEYEKTIKNKYNAVLPHEYIFHNMREIIQTYPYVQFLFLKNRQEMERKIIKLFMIKNLYEIDLQFFYDFNLI